MRHLIRRFGSGLGWCLATIWFAGHAITGSGPSRVASALVLIVMAALACFALWERIHPRPRRRRVRERENDIRTATAADPDQPRPPA